MYFRTVTWITDFNSTATQSKTVVLDPSSLYLVTRWAPEGIYCWSLFYVDPNGQTTAHGWQATTSPFGRSYAYIFKDVQSPNALEIPLQPNTIVAYFKIKGYAHVPLHEFLQICRGVVKIDYETKKFTSCNLPDMSCDTWVEKVLQRLQDDKHLMRPGEESVQNAVGEVKKHSQERNDQYLQFYLDGTVYEPVRETI